MYVELGQLRDCGYQDSYFFFSVRSCSGVIRTGGK